MVSRSYQISRSLFVAVSAFSQLGTLGFLKSWGRLVGLKPPSPQALNLGGKLYKVKQLVRILQKIEFSHLCTIRPLQSHKTLDPLLALTERPTTLTTSSPTSTQESLFH